MNEVTIGGVRMSALASRVIGPFGVRRVYNDFHDAYDAILARDGVLISCTTRAEAMEVYKQWLLKSCLAHASSEEEVRGWHEYADALAEAVKHEITRWDT